MSDYKEEVGVGSWFRKSGLSGYTFLASSCIQAWKKAKWRVGTGGRESDSQLLPCRENINHSGGQILQNPKCLLQAPRPSCRESNLSLSRVGDQPSFNASTGLWDRAVGRTCLGWAGKFHLTQ